ncbi:MAG: DUF445 family protein, partial [Calditerricola sp.]|nr:DUF445 family protein [Calditerricola sp.]
SRVLADRLRRPAAEDALARLLRALVTELWRCPAVTFVTMLPERPGSHLVTRLLRLLASPRRAGVTLAEMGRLLPARVVDVWIPAAVLAILDGLAARADRLLGSLPLAEAVREEVEAFSLPELEARIVEVAGRELRWITWIGAVIGGVVGAVQTVILWGLG